MSRSEYNDYNLDYDNYDFDYERESMKDLTACDKECEYCGNYDYQSDWRTLTNTPLKVDRVWQHFDEIYLLGHYPDQTGRSEAWRTKLSLITFSLSSTEQKCRGQGCPMIPWVLLLQLLINAPAFVVFSSPSWVTQHSACLFLCLLSLSTSTSAFVWSEVGCAENLVVELRNPGNGSLADLGNFSYPKTS